MQKSSDCQKEKINSPILQVKLKDAVPEAFELVLTYIYTDRIDPTKKSEYYSDIGQ